LLGLAGVTTGYPTPLPAQSSPALPAQSAGNFSLAAVTYPTAIRHVIVVMEENHDLVWTLTNPAFLSLYSHSAHATRAYAICHPSAPNYIAISSAVDQRCGSDRVTYLKATNLASDAASHSVSWQGLFESMPSACDRTDAYPYIAHHNPWVYYSDLKSTCAAHDLSFFTPTGASRLQLELNGSTLPALTYISPNMLHDAHDGSLAAAYSWLAKYVLHPVHASSTYAPTTAVIVLFDEAYKQSCRCSEGGGYTAGTITVSGGPIYLVVRSPVSNGTDVFTVHVTEFNVVSTIEWLLRLPSLGHQDNTKFPAMKSLFT